MDNQYGQSGNINGPDMNANEQSGVNLQKEGTQETQYGYNNQGAQYNSNGNQYEQTGQYNSQYGQNDNQYGQNGQDFNQNTGLNQGFTGLNAPDYMLWLILGIVQVFTLCCCNCTAPITGAITIVLVIMANNSFKSGNAMDYSSKMNIAKIVCCIGYGLMIVGIIISFFSGIVSSILDAI